MADEMDDIWALYADDGTQAMDATEAALLALKAEDPEAQPGLVAALFRAVHTFKGNVLGCWALAWWKAARIWPRI